MNQNGKLILDLLSEFNRPVTFIQLMQHISKAAGVAENELRDSVIDTLDGGVRYGFIQCVDSKYFTAPIDGQNIHLTKSNFNVGTSEKGENFPIVDDGPGTSRQINAMKRKRSAELPKRAASKAKLRNHPKQLKVLDSESSVESSED